MTTTTTSAALMPVAPVFTNTERLRQARQPSDRTRPELATGGRHLL